MFKQSHLVKIFWAVINLVKGHVGLQQDRQSNLEGGGSTKKTVWTQGDRLHRKNMSTKESEHQRRNKHRERQSKPREKENKYKERSVYTDSGQTKWAPRSQGRSTNRNHKGGDLSRASLYETNHFHNKCYGILLCPIDLTISWYSIT